ncbi:chloride channel protein [Amycolatopsis sp.]|uniref:chloride channel protein n=1 Tax=Amycolatopsis sp. TaxID=37632 RepID=UPI002BB8A85C|nr:chloride channel protein [Amycolatopsis sp.]HVV09500.1 chloride channel protein [Amycolatopsis sp.]
MFHRRFGTGLVAPGAARHAWWLALKLSDERKTLLVAGVAGGMAATFNAPLASILLAVELLLFEWRPRSFVPVAAAVVVATVRRGWLLGAEPVFPGPLSTAWHGIPGLAGGLLAIAATALVYFAEHSVSPGCRCTGCGGPHRAG